jgi:hypothetical protein
MNRYLPALAVCLLLVAGCGGDADSQGGDEMKRWSDNGVSVEYPESWKPLDKGEFDLEGLDFAADGPINDAGGRPRLMVFRNEREHETIKAFARSIQVGRPFELPKGHARDFEPAEVPGAEAGWRISTTFETKKKDGSPVPGELIELLAQTSDEEISISVAATKTGIDSPEVKAILSSFRVG